MLTHITIKNFILIDYISIDFANGFTVFSGETGAGKSIVLDALSFVIGEKLGPKIIRAGEEEAIVIAEFDIEGNTELNITLEKYGIIYTDSLIIRRILNRDGKSKIYINDITITASALKEIGKSLVEIHGQHDQTWMLDENYHISILDDFAENENTLSELKNAYNAYSKAKKELSDLSIAKKNLEKEQEYLEHIYNELKELNVQENEEEILTEKKALMQNSRRIEEVINNIAKTLSADEILSSIASVQRIISRNTNIMEQMELNEISDKLEEVYIILESIANNIENKRSSFHSEYNELEDIDLRLMDLKSAARKYRCQISELPKYHREIEEKIEKFQNVDNQIQLLENNLIILEKEYLEIAERLSIRRKEASNILAQKIKEELMPLKMENVEFIVDIKSNSKNFTEKGIDQVSFLISMNKGHKPDKINTVASGGELSRFMLASKIVLTKDANSKTLIFDEIDTGVGGATAFAIGRKLSALAKKYQVIVITHQPQVACFSNNHYFIKKEDTSGATVTNVHLLNKEEKNLELARMISGENITGEAKIAAQKLIEDALC